MKPKILVADDELATLTVLERSLTDGGFRFVGASDGTSALWLAREEHADLIVLGVMLPGMDGFEVYRLLRRDPRTTSIPVIFLSARADEMDRIVSFELGADDYVLKPFSGRELVLRIRRSLGRSGAQSVPATLSIGGFAIDLSRHQATFEGRDLILTATEFKLLQKLASRAGLLYTRETLLKEVWDSDLCLGSRTVDTHIRRLREKMGKAALHIETVRGIGYRFVP